MTQPSIDRVRRNYALLAPHLGQITSRFYDELFTALPETRALFDGDMAVQQRHLAAALALIVRNLDRLDLLEEPLRDLGAGHARAGVRPHHYAPVRDAMLRAIAAVAGDGWTSELADDWRALIETVSRHLLAGSAGATFDSRPR